MTCTCVLVDHFYFCLSCYIFRLNCFRHCARNRRISRQLSHLRTLYVFTNKSELLIHSYVYTIYSSVFENSYTVVQNHIPSNLTYMSKQEFSIYHIFFAAKQPVLPYSCSVADIPNILAAMSGIPTIPNVPPALPDVVLLL